MGRARTRACRAISRDSARARSAPSDRCERRAPRPPFVATAVCRALGPDRPVGTPAPARRSAGPTLGGRVPLGLRPAPRSIQSRASALLGTTRQTPRNQRHGVSHGPCFHSPARAHRQDPCRDPPHPSQHAQRPAPATTSACNSLRRGEADRPPRDHPRPHLARAGMAGARAAPALPDDAGFEAVWRALG